MKLANASKSSPSLYQCRLRWSITFAVNLERSAGFFVCEEKFVDYVSPFGLAWIQFRFPIFKRGQTSCFALHALNPSRLNFSKASNHVQYKNPWNRPCHRRHQVLRAKRVSQEASCFRATERTFLEFHSFGIYQRRMRSGR